MRRKKDSQNRTELFRSLVVKDRETLVDILKDQPVPPDSGHIESRGQINNFVRVPSQVSDNIKEVASGLPKEPLTRFASGAAWDGHYEPHHWTLPMESTI